MKIGILSLVLHNNYGGILQSYALQTILERMGNDVVVLTKDRCPKVGLKRYFKSILSVIFRNYIIRNGKKAKSYWLIEKERKIIGQYTSAFIDRYIHIRELHSLNAEALIGCDAVVVGSDQVWRSIYFKEQWKTFIEDAFLKFVENKPLKRVAYAASFGTDEWEYSDEETVECARLLKQFDAVSVRENTALKLCSEKLGCPDTQLVLDPTLLLEKEDYISLVKNRNTNPTKGDMMCYVLDMNEEMQNLVERIAEERGLSTFYANSKYEDGNATLSERIQPPVEQWLRGFMDAKFVVTDSFHACVFSIIFGKPFIAIGNKKRGVSRLLSLLDMLSLRKNLIYSINEYDSSIDYSIPDETYKILEQRIEQSRTFLLNIFS